MKTLKLFAFLQLLYFPSFGQGEGGMLCSKHKAESMGRQFRNARIAYPGDTKIDVKYHHLDLKISYANRYISGVLRTDFVTTADNFTSCSFDLNSALRVDSVLMEGKPVAFSRSGNKIDLDFGKNYAKSQTLSVHIYYQGTPRQSAFGSFSFGTHGGGAPVLWSLSEPYGAPDWWPCKDDPADKIDSVRVWITMPASFVSVSNGVLTEQKTNTDNTKTYKWFTQYPIAHYLISVASSNYAEYTDYYTYSATDSMKISHFIYPEVLTNSLKLQLDETEKMLQFFSDKFGLYPFIEEKYGHAMCGFGGGMEHQTISSMGGFNQDLVAHELAHQWFGDKINCKTWADIWVNEGFASYSEALYAENKGGKASYSAYIAEYEAYAKRAAGTVHIQNIADENQIFNYNRTYAKGAVILHMLRGILGDQMFFDVLKGYSNSEFAYGAAGIDDFRKVAERISQKDLGYFFEEWLYGESYPRYQFGWTERDKNSVTVVIHQIQLSTSPSYFSMPVELKLILENQKDTLMTVFMEGASKEFTFNQLDAAVKEVLFDPDNKIMKEVSAVNVISGLESRENLLVIYPNPTEKTVKLKHALGNVDKIEITDQLGRMVITSAGKSEEIDVSGLYPGKYYLRLIMDAEIISRPFVIR